MTQIVEPNVRQARDGQPRLELTRHVPRLKGCADGTREHEPAILPASPGSEPRLGCRTRWP